MIVCNVAAAAAAAAAAVSVVVVVVVVVVWNPTAAEKVSFKNNRQPPKTLHLAVEYLVSGWTNPIEKYSRQIASFPQVR